MPVACGPRDLHLSFRDRENESLSIARRPSCRFPWTPAGACALPTPDRYTLARVRPRLRLLRSSGEPEQPSDLSRKLELLSWGFPKTPLHRDPDRASTPGWRTTLRLEDASLELVPSLPFLPASTVSSAQPPQVCCTLHPIMGFGPFRVNDAEHALRRFQPRLPSPGPRFTPFRAFSLVRSRTASPRPLPPRRSTMPRTEVRGAVPTSRPCSTDESGFASRRCRRDRPVALLGFVPLQGPPRILCVAVSPVARRTGDPTFRELWWFRLAPEHCSSKALGGIRWRSACPAVPPIPRRSAGGDELPGPCEPRSP
jgi:hypothetical protein